MDHEEFISRMTEWLNRRVAPDGVTVDADTRLFDSGIIDSLGILRLIAWTERVIGRRIADREIRMDRFGSVRTIARSFAMGGRVVESGCAAKSGCAVGGARARCGGCERRTA